MTWQKNYFCQIIVNTRLLKGQYLRYRRNGERKESGRIRKMSAVSTVITSSTCRYNLSPSFPSGDVCISSRDASHRESQLITIMQSNKHEIESKNRSRCEEWLRELSSAVSLVFLSHETRSPLLLPSSLTRRMWHRGCHIARGYRYYHIAGERGGGKFICSWWWSTALSRSRLLPRFTCKHLVHSVKFN